MHDADHYKSHDLLNLQLYISFDCIRKKCCDKINTIQISDHCPSINFKQNKKFVMLNSIKAYRLRNY